jgi:cystathionine gamma-synthase
MKMSEFDSNSPVPNSIDQIQRELALTAITKSLPHGALTLPNFATSTFGFQNRHELHEYQSAAAEGQETSRFEYGRYGTPSLQYAESALAAWHGAQDAVLLPSGMSAISTLFLATLDQNSHIIVGDETYRRTRELASGILGKLGVEVTQVPMGDYEALKEAIRPSTKMIFMESPTNPRMRVVDMIELASIGQDNKILTVVDSTFATPVNQLPLKAGIDLVIDSATKYLGGHNNLLAGAVYGSSELIQPIRDLRGTLGPVPTDEVASKLWDGLQTLELRVNRQNQVALDVAEFLESHPAVERVYYPGLESHPDHATATEQMAGFGGVVTFTLTHNGEAASLEKTEEFIDNCKLPVLAPSLGSVIGLIESPRTMSHFSKSTEDAEAIGITNNMVRFAVGARTESSLVVADLDAALALAFGSGISGDRGSHHVQLTRVMLEGRGGLADSHSQMGAPLHVN